MKKLSVLVLAASALCLSGVASVTSQKSSVVTPIATVKNAENPDYTLSPNGCYYNVGGWAGTGVLGINLDMSATGSTNGFGTCSASLSYENAPVFIQTDGSIKNSTYVEGCGTQIWLNRNAAGQDYSGQILKIPANFSVVLGAGFAGTINDFEGQTIQVTTDTPMYYLDKDGGTAGHALLAVTMPTSLTVQDDFSVASGKSAKVEVSYEGGSEELTTYYYIGDTGVANVDAEGNITGVSAGTTTLTVVRGELKQTVNITVTGAELAQTGIKVKVGKQLTVKRTMGYKLSDIQVIKVLEGDVEGGVIEITEENISGTFDKDTIGTYTLTVTVGEFSDTFTVIVEDIEKVTLLNTVSGSAFGNNSLWGTFFYIVFSNKDIGQYLNVYGEALETIRNSVLLNGQPFIQSMKNLGGSRYEFWPMSGVSAKAGDVITMPAGLPIYQYSGTCGENHEPQGDGEFYPAYETSEAYKFVYTGSTWEIWTADATELTVSTKSAVISVSEAKQIEYTVGPAGTYGTPTFESANPEVATVSDSGLITGLAVGETTITVKLGSVEHTVPVTVMAQKNIKTVKLTNIPNYYSLIKGSDVSEFKPNLSTFKLVFEDDTLSPEMELTEEMYTIGEVSTAETGDFNIDVKVTYKEVEYTTSIALKVYELYDQEIKEVAIVDWFNYAVFIQFENTSTNRANITSFAGLSDQLSKISYTRKDGTEVKLTGNYQLATNVAIFPEFLNESEGHPAINVDNYNSEGYYQVGDTITIEDNLPLYKWTGDFAATETDNGAVAAGTGEYIVEGYVHGTRQYKYNGQVWTTWIEYEDILLTQTTMTLEVNKTAAIPVSRVPANATQGVFTYTSSDETVVKVSSNGIMKALKAGTATITVTLSDEDYPEKTKTATLTVTVTDNIASIKITNEQPLNVTQGTSEEDLLAKLTGTYVYQSGKEEGAVDFTNAKVSGYDQGKTGTQNIVVTVTVDGKDISGTCEINVTAKSGCGGSIIATSIALSAIAVTAGALGIAYKAKSKKKEDK